MVSTRLRALTRFASTSISESSVAAPRRRRLRESHCRQGRKAQYDREMRKNRELFHRETPSKRMPGIRRSPDTSGILPAVYDGQRQYRTKFLFYTTTETFVLYCPRPRRTPPPATRPEPRRQWNVRSKLETIGIPPMTEALPRLSESAMVNRQNVEALRARIVQRYEGLSPRLKQVAAYALEHPNDIGLETLAVIAKRCKVQPSTIVRFAKTFGYDGASEMQKLFRDELLSLAPEPELCGSHPPVQRARRRCRLAVAIGTAARIHGRQHRRTAAPEPDHAPGGPRARRAPDRRGRIRLSGRACAAPSRSPPILPTRSVMRTSALTWSMGSPA